MFNNKISLKQLVCLSFYYGIAYWLPNSYSIIGVYPNKLRIFLCKRIFLKCGNLSTINRKVNFGSGRKIIIGDNSGIGANTSIPSDTLIGKNVMISRNIFILNRNHNFSRVDIPIKNQGFKPSRQTILEDDCWIGMNSLLTPGRHVKKGTIIAMGSVLTRDYPEYSVVGGNPAKLIRSRLSNE